MNVSIEKDHRIGEIFFALLSFCLFVFSPVSFISNSLAAILCIGVLVRIRRVTGKTKRQYEFYIRKITFKYSKWYEIVLFLLVNTYLTMAFFGYNLFLDNTAFPSRILRLAIFTIGYIWTAFVLQSGLDAIRQLTEYRGKTYAPVKSGYWKKWFVLLTISFSIFLLWQIAYNPIIVSVDSWGYLEGWRNNRYIMNRSPVYAVLIKIICSLAPTKPEVIWIAVAQNLGISSLISAILMWFNKKGMNFIYTVAVAAIVPLVPSLGLFTLNILSDFPCAVFMLWLTYALVRIVDEVVINNTASIRQRVSLHIQVGLSLTLVAVIRQNTLIVCIAMVAALLIMSVRRKQYGLLISTVVSVVFVLLIRFPGYNMLNVRETESMYSHRYVAGIHDMQAVYYEGGNLSEETYKLLNEYINDLDDKVKRNFRPDFVDYDTYNTKDIHLFTSKDFIIMYADTFIKNPAKTLRSMLWRVRSYWVIDPKGELNFVNRTTIFDTDNEGSWSEKYATSSPKLGAYRNPNILTNIMDKYIGFMNRTIPATFIWRFGIWASLMLISATALILQKRFIWLLGFIPVTVFLAGLYLTNGWTDYRLGLPVFFIGMFLPPAMIFIQRSTEQSTCQNESFVRNH